jgi:NitT/TauT family transport system permease protein
VRISRTDVFFVGGALAILGVSELAGETNLLGSAWPAPTDVVAHAVSLPLRPILGRALASTAEEFATGYGIGILVGLAIAAIAVVAPPAREGLDRLALLIESVPTLALGPISMFFIGREHTPQLLAGLAAGFVVYMAVSSGLSARDTSRESIFLSLGTSRVRRLMLFDGPRVVPNVVDGLKLAVPAAMLGTVVGQWFGASRGLGVLVVTGMTNGDMDLLWSAALVIAATSLCVYALLTILLGWIKVRYSDG